MKRKINWKKIVKSKEWNNDYLPYDRVILIAVAEGIRPGFEIELTKNKKKILDLLGLYYKKPPIKGWELHDVSKDEKRIEKYQKEMWNILKKRKPLSFVSAKDTDFVAGEFFGYPSCCIKRFPRGPKFGIEVSKMIKNGKYKDEFNFMYWIPCSLNCKKSIKLARKIKTAVEKADSKTADEIRRDKMGGFLSCFIKYVKDPLKVLERLEGMNLKKGI